jgi:hypothetical protein
VCLCAAAALSCDHKEKTRPRKFVWRTGSELCRYNMACVGEGRVKGVDACCTCSLLLLLVPNVLSADPIGPTDFCVVHGSGDANFSNSRNKRLLIQERLYFPVQPGK